MTPYYHQSNISTRPPTPGNGNTFPPLRFPLLKDKYMVKHRSSEEERGPFDEDDIELQISSQSSSSKLETGLKILKYCLVMFIGLLIIGTSIHIYHVYYQEPLIDHYQVSQGSPSGSPDIDSGNQAPPDFKYDTIRHTTIQIPTHPSICNEAECLTHQIPGSGAIPIATATTLAEQFSTPTSPPICVPPHCFPHQQDYDNGIKIDSKTETTGLDEGDQSPPICVPPHCYPHAPGETPPICVPPHCFPHPPPGHHHDHDHHQEGGNDMIIDATATLELEEVDQSPTICVPPHCYPSNLPGYHPLPAPTDEGHPPICISPHCYPHSTHHDIRIYEEYQSFTIQTDQEREHEYLSLHPEIVSLHNYISTQEEEDKDEDEDEDTPIWCTSC